MSMIFIILLLLAYVIGTFPSGPLMAKIFNLGNLRAIGSGNPGATNVLRTGNKFAAAMTLFLDGFKGTLAVWLYHLSPELTVNHGLLFGIMAFLGHLYPIWFKFQGGKGVATYLGVLFGINVIFGVFGCIIWLVGCLLSKISSLGALNMAFLMPILLYLGSDNFYIPLTSLFLSILLIYKHKENIKRLAQGLEPKIGKKA